MINMVKQKITVQHIAYLTINEEQRFVDAVLRKYGYTHGNVNQAIHEAVMDWISKMEREK